MISQQMLDEFKQLYLKDYGVMLTDVEALEKCTALFNGLDIIFGHPVKMEKIKDKNGELMLKGYYRKNKSNL